jgi:hypothetical protein
MQIDKNLKRPRTFQQILNGQPSQDRFDCIYLHQAEKHLFLIRTFLLDKDQTSGHFQLHL